MIKIGTCGWSVKGGKKAYFEKFNVIELQETFYRLPRFDTVRKWREIAPADFEFTVKGWQVITHPPYLPTWRRCNLRISESQMDKYGFFKPTEEVYNSWEKVKEICHILKSTVCIFQTPPSFKYTQENLNNVITFFTTISRDNINIGWEPRGDWNKPEYRTQLRKLFEEIDVCHVVDPLRREPVYTTNISYFRLHGLGGREVNYKYKYTNEDLRKLYTIVQKYMDTKDIVYVMFNNVFMSEDALRFKSYFQE